MKVLLADDHTIIRDALRWCLTDVDAEVVGEAADGEEAISEALRLAPDVVLMDVVMPHVDGIEATRRIIANDPAARVVVLSRWSSAAHRRAALRAGAADLVSKEQGFATLWERMRSAVGDDRTRPWLLPVDFDPLTERQVEVLQHYANGRTTRQVAGVLGISTKTVQNHLNGAYRALETQTLTQAVLVAARLDLIYVN